MTLFFWMNIKTLGWGVGLELGERGKGERERGWIDNIS